MNLLNQNLAVIHSPVDQGYRMRLMLLTYCHATEMFDFYSVIGNMLRVYAGERCSMDCFIGANHSSGKDAKYPLPKALRIKEWATAAGLPEVGDLVLDMLVKEVRNAFFHSSYVLTNDSLNIKRGDGVLIGNLISPKVEYKWLLPRIELGINTVLSLISLMDESRLSYTENKVVMGRIQGDQPGPIELTTQPGYGIVGFQSPPAKNV